MQLELILISSISKNFDMKKKLKKLELKKSTITNLSEEKMRDIQGGTFSLITITDWMFETHSDTLYVSECEGCFEDSAVMSGMASQYFCYSGCLITDC